MSRPYTLPGENTPAVRKKIPVAILGACSSIGQRLVEILSSHPWFEIVQLTSCEKSAKKPYSEAVNWLLPSEIPLHVRSMVVTDHHKKSKARFAFSVLDATNALQVETSWAEEGTIVVSHAKSHRRDNDVPLLIPEVNEEHLSLVHRQKYPNGGGIVCSPQASTIGLSIALKPLHDHFLLDKIHVTTYQPISCAGFPGIPSMAIMDNVIPFIAGEEEKLEHEPQKIFSTYSNGVLIPPDFVLSASCARVPILEGLLESVSLSFKKKVSLDEVRRAFIEFRPRKEVQTLPSACKRVIHFFDEQDAPQPKFHKYLEGGMAVSVGALRPAALFDCKFFVLSHNAIRGAAGGLVQIAELMNESIAK